MRSKLAGILGAFALMAGTVGVCAEEEKPVVQPPPGMIELKLALPKPMFQGTPTNIVSDNLDRESIGKARPPYFVPEGTTNVARDKKVTSSDKYPIIGEIDYLTDGDKQAMDGSFVELAPGLQWVQVDLEAPKVVHALVIWHYHSDPRVYRDVIIQISDDVEFKEGVTTVFNNDHDNSAGLGLGKGKEWIETNEGRLIEAKGAKGRYVRLYSRGNTSNDMNHYTEVEIYGSAVE